MRRMLVSGALGVLLVLLLPASRSDAWWAHGGHWHGGGWGWGGPRVVVGIGPGFGWGWGPGYGYSPPPYFYYYPPPVYIQRPAPPPAWYYCESERGYYPHVPACPEPWVRVAPE